MALMPGSGLMMGEDPQHLGAMTQNPMGGGGFAGMHDMSMMPMNGGQGPMVSPIPGPGKGRSAEDRQLAQWGYHETKEFIALRAELEKTYVQTKDNTRTMWELIANQMKERGYRRTAAQCKTKWKVLVNRYKGKEIADDADKSTPPFYEELDAIFKERAKNMDRLLLESEMGAAAMAGEMQPGGMQLKAKSLKGNQGKGRSDEENTDEEEEPDDVEEVEEVEGSGGGKKRKHAKKDGKETKERKTAQSIQEVLEQFFLQQLKLEQEWREAIERREAERRMREREWRERMEALEKERFAREVSWRAKEDERRAREEARAERRDQLIAALLSKLG